MQSCSQIITTNKPTSNFLQAECPSYGPANSVEGKALEAVIYCCLVVILWKVPSCSRKCVRAYRATCWFHLCFREFPRQSRIWQAQTSKYGYSLVTSRRQPLTLVKYLFSYLQYKLFCDWMRFKFELASLFSSDYSRLCWFVKGFHTRTCDARCLLLPDAFSLPEPGKWKHKSVTAWKGYPTYVYRVKFQI